MLMIVGNIIFAQVEYYPTINGTLADSFRIGNDYFVTISFDSDSSTVHANVNGNRKRFVFEDDSLIINLVDFSALAEASIEALTDTVDMHDYWIVGLQSAIQLKANVTSLDSLQNRLSTAEGTISTHASNISNLGEDYASLVSAVALKANATSLDSVKGRMTTAEGTISTHASNISTLQSGVSSLQSAVALKASISSLDTLTGRVSTAESGISANTSGISTLSGTLSGVVTSLLLYAKKDSIISSINITPESIKISSAKVEFDGDVIAASLTGKTISTASSGPRIVIDGSANTINIHTEAYGGSKGFSINPFSQLVAATPETWYRGVDFNLYNGATKQTVMRLWNVGSANFVDVKGGFSAADGKFNVLSSTGKLSIVGGIDAYNNQYKVIASDNFGFTPVTLSSLHLPIEVVYTNTAQTISGAKTLSGVQSFSNEVRTTNVLTVYGTGSYGVAGYNAVNATPPSSGQTITLTGMTTGQNIFVTNTSGSLAITICGVSLPASKSMYARYNGSAWNTIISN